MRLLKLIVSPLLALLVLLSGMGFFVDHMVCSISGTHRLAINTQVDHCSDSCSRTSDTHSVKRECCDYESNYFKEDVLSHQKKERKDSVLLTAQLIPSRIVLALPVALRKVAFSPFPDLPPPHVRWHVLLQVFVI
jgi:hypothetical protein